VSYIVKSKFYVGDKNSIESYVLIGDGNENKNFEIEEIVEISGEHEDSNYVHYNCCKKCGYVTYGGFKYCPWCGKNYINKMIKTITFKGE